jgi:hypothetical protein
MFLQFKTDDGRSQKNRVLMLQTLQPHYSLVAFFDSNHFFAT